MAATYLGNEKIRQIFLGSTKIKKAYLGNTKVYSGATMVTYHVDTGTDYTEEIDEGESVLTPSSFIPSKTGYTFLGWREDTTASSEVLDSRTAYGDTMELYAVFRLSVTVSYNGNGATSGSVATQTGYKYYNNGNESANPTFTIRSNGFARTNYTFYRWKLNNGGTLYKAGQTLTTASSCTMYVYWIAATASTFNYTGRMQSFTALAGVTYRIQLYGAQGGSNQGYSGGAGGYAIGYRKPTNNETWYVGVGGAASTFNGGGTYRQSDGAAGANGGGASHVGLSNAQLSGTPVGNLIGCAGGGGGGGGYFDGLGSAGGSGGGTSGGNCGILFNGSAYGGTQSGGGLKGPGSYGQGAHVAYNGGGGGGGGYYGGGFGDCNGGGGGSGNTRGMTSASMSNGQKSGNGQVLITVYSVA